MNLNIILLLPQKNTLTNFIYMAEKRVRGAKHLKLKTKIKNLKT